MDYTIQSEKLTVKVSSEGAELQSIKSADGTEYLWQGDASYWKEHAPNLFPYVGRLTEGSYLYKGKRYEMPMHGFLKRSALCAKAVCADSLTLCLESSDETRACYPFDFIFQITYTLRENTIFVKTTVENTGSGRMYFALGGHPGFRVPLEENLSFEDYFLEFSSPSHPDRVKFSETCYPVGIEQEYSLQEGRRIPLAHELFAHDAIVLRHMPDTVKLASDKGTRSVTVYSPDFPYVGFWHTWKGGLTEAPYVCIEPWTSLPSRDGIVEDISCQSDLICLGAGKLYENTWEIRIQ